jgi:LEA14-like dessication related protein
MGTPDRDGEDLGSLGRKVRRLWAMRWLKIAVTLVIAMALVGHVALVLRTANSLEVERVSIVSVAPGVVVGDFLVTFELTLHNPTGGSIEVDRLTYDLFLEDDFIGDGEKSDFKVEPGSQRLDFQVTFNAYELSTPAQELFFSSTAKLTIDGEVTVPIKLFGVWRYTEVTVPYEHEEQVSSGTEPPDNPPPNPVLLEGVYRPTASASLTWTMNGDGDFSRYEVHHSTSPDFTPSEQTRLTSITEQTTTQYTASNLQHLTTHYFIVRVYDTAGQHADSNVGSVLIP